MHCLTAETMKTLPRFIFLTFVFQATLICNGRGEVADSAGKVGLDPTLARFDHRPASRYLQLTAKIKMKTSSVG